MFDLYITRRSVAITIMVVWCARKQKNSELFIFVELSLTSFVLRIVDNF